LDSLNESAFFRLAQNETVTGLPAFNGGTSGSTPPFSVDSTYHVLNLNADYLDGFHEGSFFRLAQSEVVTGRPSFNGGLSGSTPPFYVDSTYLVAGLNADYLDGFHQSTFFNLAQNETVTGRPSFNGGVSGSTPPFSVDSTMLVANLNADLLDGQQSTAFATSGHNHDAAYVNVTGDAMTGSLDAAYPGANFYAMKGRGQLGPTNGYLGVQGQNGYDGVTSTYWSGDEIGVLGISTGTSTTDNYGVLGHASQAGVRGEYSGDPNNYGELGRAGYGVYANGTTYGGYFTGGKNYFSGDVGIGTTTPGYKLEVNGSMGTSADASSKLRVGRFSAGAPNSYISATSGADSMRLQIADSTKVTITSSGNVGIGTMTPDAGLHLKGSSYPSSFMYLESNTNEDTGFRLYESTTVKWHLFNDSTSDGLSLRNNAYSSILFAKQSTGNIGIGTTSPTEKLTIRGGNLLIERSDGTDIVELGEGLDYAEGFDVSESTKIDAGSVLIIDADNPGKLALSNKAYDTKVAGIVAGAKGLGSGVRLGAGEFDHDVALAGRVYCKVDATESGVEPGDLLTTCTTPGHAMKAADYTRAQGAILGKAMESIQKGQKGQILVLVTLQ
jgi:hypothetical protein